MSAWALDAAGALLSASEGWTLSVVDPTVALLRTGGLSLWANVPSPLLVDTDERAHLVGLRAGETTLLLDRRGMSPVTVPVRVTQ